MNIYVYSDGSCNWQTRVGGWCAILVACDGDESRFLSTARLIDASRSIGSAGVGKGDGFKIRVLSGGEKDTTNNRMEISAILEAIKAMKPCAVTIVSDSQYAIRVLSGKVKRNKNIDLIKEFDEAAQGFSITWKWVEGHAGNPFNELADTIARREYEKQTATGTTSPTRG